ncbi:MAG: DUF2786 domain-containing protein [Dehalococcoidia bacterium]|nr:DUF2786 domain-containing protein [Dehalococcoidia bacterium]
MTAPDRMQSVIAALLAKTVENGCSEQEAASALEKAQELLLRYNLSAEEVQTRADGHEALQRRVGQQDVEVAGGFKWRASLLAAIARANLCRVVLSDEGERGTIHVFGKQENVRVVLDMWTWVAEQLERLAFGSLRDYMQPTQQARWDFHADGSVTPRPWTPKGDEDEAIYLAGFYRAAVKRIDQRLETAMRRFQAESEQTRALVVSSGRELSEAVRRIFPQLARWSGMPNYGRDGMKAGARAGDRVKLTRDPALSGAGGASLRLGAGR